MRSYSPVLKRSANFSPHQIGGHLIRNFPYQENIPLPLGLVHPHPRGPTEIAAQTLPDSSRIGAPIPTVSMFSSPSLMA